MMNTVKIYKNNTVFELKAKFGENLLDFLHKNNIPVNSACAGKGTCGKCKIKVIGVLSPPSKNEIDLLGRKELEKGYRLACYNTIDSDISIYIEEDTTKAKIMTKSTEYRLAVDPIIKKKHIVLNQPAIEDQKSDLERLIENFDFIDANSSLYFIRNLPGNLRKKDYSITLTYMEDKLVCVEPGDTSNKQFGIAVDIGTTTIAAYLYNLINGQKLDVYSILNPQKKFGADVLSRIEYTMRSPFALEEMNKIILDAINNIIKDLAEYNKIKISDIYLISFAGNTTMLHFLLGIPAKNISVSPFIPATTLLHKFKTNDLGININSGGYALILPCVSAYIGADIVAGVLSSKLNENSEISLLVDIGTNGEIVLGNSDWMYACSTAAGPAFEGANIRNGVGGITGAIDKVSFSPKFSFTTIGNQKPIGICGSGLIDAVSGMLASGIIDETGRIADDDEMSLLPCELSKRIIETDGIKSFLLADENSTASGDNIVITQKDIRELQNAKAAIAAGIKTLVKRAGINMSDISNVYLAGGFGSFISIDSAFNIGLIPKELKGKVKSIGNSAGTGVSAALLSAEMLKKTDMISKKIQYIELSSSSDFVNEYVDNMVF